MAVSSSLSQSLALTSLPKVPLRCVSQIRTVGPILSVNPLQWWSALLLTSLFICWPISCHSYLYLFSPASFSLSFRCLLPGLPPNLFPSLIIPHIALEFIYCTPSLKGSHGDISYSCIISIVCIRKSVPGFVGGCFPLHLPIDALYL